MADENRLQIYEQLKSRYGELDTLHQLALLSGFEERVPPIEKFIDDDYYLGKVLGSNLYPIWRDAAIRLYPTPYNTTANEIYLTGGIGLGKSTFAKLVTAYDLCKVLCLRSPQKYFKLTPGTQIMYALMNATKGLAGSVLLSEMMEWFEISPFFQKNLNPAKGSLFRKNVTIGIGSRGSDMLGQATVGAIFSEINDMTKVHGQATDVFDTISTRMESRFGGKGRDLIGHLILDSSNKGTKSFIDTRLEEKRKAKLTDYMVFRYAHWEAKWHLGQYSGEMFKVYAGDAARDPFILKDNPDIDTKALKQNRIIEVPVEHYDAFKFNIVKSLRDLAGVSTFGSATFISSRVAIKEALKLRNPVTKNVIELDFFDRNQQLIQFVELHNLLRVKKPRYIHIDIGLKNDSTGIASSYLEKFIKTKSIDPVSGEVFINETPVFRTDFVMEVTAKPGHEVPIYKLKQLIFDLRARGYPIQRVSTDGYQSSNLRQDLTLKGVKASLISLDRTTDGFTIYRDAILERRYSGPNTAKLEKELTELEEVQYGNHVKVDHPEGGSKDVADAAAGSVYNCYLNYQEDRADISSDDISNALDALQDYHELGSFAGSPQDELMQRVFSKSRS